ncbi:hypothetical protein C2857_005631 [Epichloe festucae Fl1]|uniref:Gfd2/YDR514C-like C-terminal domain-containing protein n=1 Tax=Epichloe festucae (strain Fl1) TaxID=877507 RepID=A0A7S9KSW8_EPIFF|nr:hypothetical protein C2857_005631 [Epichloe festucae Fl1]
MSDNELHAQLEKLQEVLGKKITLDPAKTKSTVEPEASVRQNSASAWQEQYLTYEKSRGDTVPSRLIGDEFLYEGFDDSALCIGEPLEEDVAFCPFERIKQYPEQFIGKRNKPLAQPFFDSIDERKTWRFFELHFPGEPQQSCLLVPTVQFVNFLKEVNSHLGTQLCIPKGNNQLHFSMNFGHGGTPRPRYIGNSHEKPRVLVDNYQVIDDDLAAFDAATEEDRNSWLASWKKAKASLAYQRVDAAQRAKLAAERAEKKRIAKETMLTKVQTYLGTPDGQLIGDLDRKPTLFVSIDIEVIEVEPRSITEIGIAVLDTRNIQERDSGPGGIFWWEHIKAYHLVVRQHASHVNYKYVQGCPDKFQFGESMFPNKWELIDTLSSILSPYTRDGVADVVLVGHDTPADVRYLSNAGYDVDSALKLVDTVDTQILHQAWKGGKQPRKLESVLSDLCITYTYLHNAGNDAVYTLRAMITMGVEGSKPEGQPFRQPQLAAEHGPLQH